MRLSKQRGAPLNSGQQLFCLVSVDVEGNIEQARAPTLFVLTLLLFFLEHDGVEPEEGQPCNTNRYHHPLPGGQTAEEDIGNGADGNHRSHQPPPGVKTEDRFAVGTTPGRQTPTKVHHPQQQPTAPGTVLVSNLPRRAAHRDALPSSVRSVVTLLPNLKNLLTRQISME
jgi:hypothetical protein